MRLIDADKLEVISYTDTEGREDTFDAGVQWLAELIDEQPTVDAVLVVHCKECDKRGTIFCPMVHETLGSGLVDYASDDGYCSWARRKE